MRARPHDILRGSGLVWSDAFCFRWASGGQLFLAAPWLVCLSHGGRISFSGGRGRLVGYSPAPLFVAVRSVAVVVVAVVQLEQTLGSVESWHNHPSTWRTRCCEQIEVWRLSSTGSGFVWEKIGEMGSAIGLEKKNCNNSAWRVCVHLGL